VRRAGPLVTLALGLALAGVAARADTMVTDSAGRRVMVPEPGRIKTVFAAGPPASILLYILAPDRMSGWPRALRPEERDYIAGPYRDLPELGRLTGRGDTANLEVVLSVKPQLIVDFGSVRETYVSLADRVQERLGIPYLLIDGRFENTAAALRLLGGVLGVSERAERLARYVENTFAELDSTLATIPAEARPRVYLARGADGLETGLAGSINTEIIERAGGRNVAAVPGRYGISGVSMEQVLTWNPDTVITWDRNFFAAAQHDPTWQTINALKSGRFYLSPTAPFGWIDRPPSLNRIMGLKWLAGLFYPAQIKQDLRATTREFYRLFYHVELSEPELDRLLAWADGRPPR
jgi:iron complex transport system substrate-binding protein